MRLEFDLPHNVPPLEVAAGYRLIFRGTTIRFRQLIGRTEPKGRLDRLWRKNDRRASPKILFVATSTGWRGLPTAAAEHGFVPVPYLEATAARTFMATASSMKI